MARVHETLQVAFGWDYQHLNRFEIRGREYAVYREGGGMIGIDASRVQLDELSLRRLERFVYEYDFGDAGIHDLRLETTLRLDPRKTYPLSISALSNPSGIDVQLPCRIAIHASSWTSIHRDRRYSGDQYV